MAEQQIVNVVVLTEVAGNVVFTHFAVRGVKVFDYLGGKPFLLFPNHTYLFSLSSTRFEMEKTEDTLHQLDVENCLITLETGGNLHLKIKPGEQLIVREYALADVKLTVQNGKFSFTPA